MAVGAVEGLCVGSLSEDEFSAVRELVGHPCGGGGDEEGEEGEDHASHFVCMGGKEKLSFPIILMGHFLIFHNV